MEADAPKQWRLNSFFSGIGGFELAFERQGFSAAFTCENDPFCESVLKRHWPDVVNARDIRCPEVEIPDASLWTAGFPCQDVSLAKAPHGREGFRGTKSSLFFAFHDHLREHLPEVVLLENVAGLLNSHGGADFLALLKALTELGYAVTWRVLNARYFGVPQSRPRVFICAWMKDAGRAVSSLFEAIPAATPKREREGFITPTRCPITGAVVPHIAYCVSATSARHTGLDWARSYISYDRGVRRPTPLECERLQGFPENWSVPAPSYVTPIGGYDTERYKAVGNAVAIPVVEWIADRIRNNFDNPLTRTQQIDALTEIPAAESTLRGLTAEFAGPGVQTQRLSATSEVKWQRSGCALGDVVVHAPASSSPVKVVSSRFVDLLEKGPVDERYYLSPNAARGIIRRIERAGRHLFPPLDAALRGMASGRLIDISSDVEDQFTIQEVAYG